MDLIAHIGRDLPEPIEFDINVSNEFLNVSRQHATVHWHGINNGKEGIVVIEDHDTPNGTFVNGRQYARVKLNENDTVRLGGNTKDDYQLDLKKLFDVFKQAELKKRTDFSEEFENEVKKAYMDYSQDVLKLKKKMSVKGQIPKILASVAGYGVSSIIVHYYPAVGSIGFVLSTVFMVFAVGPSIGSSDKQERKIAKLQLDYQSKYCCPKCGRPYDFSSKTWAKLETYGHCIHSDCDAVFKEPETK